MCTQVPQIQLSTITMKIFLTFYSFHHPQRQFLITPHHMLLFNHLVSKILPNKRSIFVQTFQVKNQDRKTQYCEAKNQQRNWSFCSSHFLVLITPCNLVWVSAPQICYSFYHDTLLSAFISLFFITSNVSSLASPPKPTPSYYLSFSVKS